MQKHNHWRWSRKATPCRWRLRLHIYFNFAKVIVNCWTWIEFLRDARKEWKMPSKRQKAGLGFAHTSFTLSTASLCCLVVVELNIQFFSTLLCCVWRSPGKLNINNLIKAVNETFFFYYYRIRWKCFRRASVKILLRLRDSFPLGFREEFRVFFA